MKRRVVPGLKRRYAALMRHRRLLRIYRPLVAKDDLCFDIGAHSGSWSKVWLRLGARVVAVEPQPDLVAKYLVPLGVSVERVAVGDREGEATMSLAAEASTVASLAPHWQDGYFKTMTWDRAIAVPVTTLDKLIAKHGVPQVCKIDVEGYEREVLRGLTHPLPLLSFEFQSRFVSHALECLDRIEQLGNYEGRILIGSDRFLSAWDSLDSIRRSLQVVCDTTPDRFGDVFVRLRNH